MFVYVSKDPYTYVWGTHKFVQKKAKVPFGTRLETADAKPYGGAWKLLAVPSEYWGSYSHDGYPEWWIAEADVSVPVSLPFPPPPPSPEPSDALDVLTGIMRDYGIKSITLG